MFQMQRTLICALALASSLVSTDRGYSQEACPNQVIGELKAEARLVSSEPDELAIEVVLRNVGSGPVLIYPFLVPKDCFRSGGPYLYLSVSTVSAEGVRRNHVGACSDRLRDPSGFEFLPLLPGDFIGRRVVLHGPSFRVPHFPSGDYELALSVSTEARNYLRRHRPNDLPCAINSVFQGELKASTLRIVVP